MFLWRFVVKLSRLSCVSVRLCMKERERKREREREREIDPNQTICLQKLFVLRLTEIVMSCQDSGVANGFGVEKYDYPAFLFVLLIILFSFFSVFVCFSFLFLISLIFFLYPFFKSFFFCTTVALSFRR